MLRKGRISLVLVLTLTVLLAGCQTPVEQAEERTKEVFAMDTYFTLTAYGEQADAALDLAEQEIRRLEKMWSVTQPDSELYAINHREGSYTPVSQDTMELIAYAKQMAQETNDALDPTIYPVVRAWGFTTGEYRIPSQEEIDQLVQSVNYESISLTDDAVMIPEAAQLDLGAVAKGDTGDRVAELLKAQGVTSALLNLGGNVQAVGAKPDGAKWRVGIRDPYSEAMLGVLEVEDAAVITSGGYERYFTGEDGVNYWHILDPATERPADSGLVSVTVVGREGKYCDALSTALFVMGLEDASAYWREHQDFDMILMTEQGDLYLTQGIQDCFTLSETHQDLPIYTINKISSGGNL